MNYNMVLDSFSPAWADALSTWKGSEPVIFHSKIIAPMYDTIEKMKENSGKLILFTENLIEEIERI